MSEYKTNLVDLNLVDDLQLSVNFESEEEIESIISNTSSSLKMLSLFSGCGGMDLGFEGGFSVLKSSINEVLTPNFIAKELDKNIVMLKKTRFKTVFANDILKEARNAWVNYFSKRGHNFNDFETESIVDLVKLHKSGTKIFPSNIDIVTGGFPCQDFSVSGKRNGFNSHKNHKGELIGKSTATEETRGKLYIWMKKVIEITKPKIFIAENVKGLINLENVKDIIQEDFSSIGGNGYLVLNPRVLQAADYGVPQSRERVFFIGIKKSELKSNVLNLLENDPIPDSLNPYPNPTHSYTTNELNLKKVVTLKDLFQDLHEPIESDDLSHKFYSKAKFMGRHCQGQTEINLNGISPTIRAEHHGNIEFRRLAKENGGKILDELSKGYVERRLTPRECGLIQTFPLDYEFVIENTNNSRKSKYLVSPSKAYKLIGNAVPPLLAYNLARRIESLWDIYF